jgi:acetyltransferase-like isoleucine patch superfamily enzyme
MLGNLILKIKRRENRVYGIIYEIAEFILSFNLFTIKLIHLPLYYFDIITKVAIKRVIEIFWSIPLFKARCERAGKNLRLPDGIPLVIGDHLRIYLGNDVMIRRSTIGASKVFDNPILEIGNKSSIGYGTLISVTKEVVIGDNCLIGPNCLIMDSDDHPIEPQKRLLGENVDKETVFPVKIGNNVWVGAYSTILKGVNIGDNAVIGVHTVVTRDVMPNCIYVGYPAKVIQRDIDKGDS